MSTGRLTIRSTIAILTLIATTAPPSSIAHAGCFDWLFGRPTAPYTAGYPAPYTAGYPSTTGYTSGAPLTVNSVPMNPGFQNSGVVQAQRPAYGAYSLASPPLTTVQSFDNPSVYTGLPVTGGPSIPANASYSAQRPSLAQPYSAQPYSAQPYSAQPYSAQRLPIRTPSAMATTVPQPVDTYRVPISAPAVPIASTLRGNATVNPIVSLRPYTAYSPGDVAPVNYQAAPPTSVQTLPIAPPPPRRGCGLSRFFNSLLGRSETSYTTSYYRAPITYYRPATTINPVTGTTVTVQQPCTSYVQQLQRVPSNGFVPMQNSTAAVQAGPGVCASPTYGGSIPQTSYPPNMTPNSFAPPSSIGQGSIGQVGGEFPSGSFGVSPIPSTLPPTGYPNTAPLTGASPGDPIGNASDAADQTPLPRPELEANRPDFEASNDAPPEEQKSDKPALNEGYGDDLYPYGDPGSTSNDGTGNGEANGNGNGDANEDPDKPAIQLDPPVTGTQPNTNPNNSFTRTQQFTIQPPPSLNASGDTETWKPRQLSTLRPIGVPEQQVPQNTAPTTPPSTVRQPETPPALEPPPLPAPSNRAADPSALFRNTESSASSRLPNQTRVTVPIREATTRHQSVRPVAAWEEVRQRPAPRPPRPVVRDNSGWMPAP